MNGYMRCAIYYLLFTLCLVILPAFLSMHSANGVYRCIVCASVIEISGLVEWVIVWVFDFSCSLG